MCLACPTRRGLLAAAAVLSCVAPARAEPLVEPRLRVRQPAVAVTLDACGGGFDERIARVLAEAEIPATVFATEVWLRRNPAALAWLLAHPALFGFGNHGARHVPAVLGFRTVFGVAAAGDMATIRQEVLGGAAALEDAAGARCRWFRGATAQYSPTALAEIGRMGFAVAGYSVNGDAGASLPAAAAAARIGAAGPGDVILAHANKPHGPSGPGVAAGLVALKRQGARFARLDRLGPEETQDL